MSSGWVKSTRQPGENIGISWAFSLGFHWDLIIKLWDPIKKNGGVKLQKVKVQDGLGNIQYGIQPTEHGDLINKTGCGLGGYWPETFEILESHTLHVDLL